ncbi:Trm112 family protein [Echinimonas agarilytica]|uniref:UPF0434 protein NAF29_09735 n=1 Tax=Echinimonas agarilytica TaxID=1215918 RepID=A0AA42B7G5_9GAMM|nr:Trm112 family protein [Echinimonas agarilytica]MCM2679945.1 Trm112 family protein [Echinimonas agarilytica]
MAFDIQLLEILACPVCKGKLTFDATEEERLVCRFDRLAYPINKGIPVLIEEEAETLSSEELPK